MDGFDLKNIPNVYFVLDFKGPGGYIPLGYTKHEFGNLIQTKLNDINDEMFVGHYSSIQQPHIFSKNRTAEFSNYIVEYTKNTKFVLTHQIKNNIEKDSIYLVVLESLNVNNMFEYYSDDSFPIEDFFSPILLQLIKKNSNFKIVFVDAGEGAYRHDIKLLYKLHNFLKRNQIFSKRKILISTNNNFIENIKNLPEFKKFNGQIDLYCNNHLITTAGRFISHLRTNKTNTIVERGYTYSIQDEIHTNPREKYFLMYNRNGERVHRVWFVNQLYKKNLIEKGFISFFGNEHLDKFLEGSTHYPELTLNNEDLLDIKQNYKKFNPLVIDSDDPNAITFFHNFLSRKDEYENSYFTIVSETNAESQYCFITEKTIKPIMNLHPFVVLGNPHTLKVLKSLGFKTFDKWWDESYDNEFDFKTRSIKVLKVVEELCLKSHEEWKIMIEEMSELLINNKKVLHKLATSKHAQKEFFDKVLEIDRII
jgi:hypothetical protein